MSRDMDDVLQDQDFHSTQEEFDTTCTPTKGIYEATENQDIDVDVITAENTEKTVSTQGLGTESADEGSKNSGGDDHKSEDLFLDIAHTDTGGQELVTWSDRRTVGYFPLAPLVSKIF